MPFRYQGAGFLWVMPRSRGDETVTEPKELRGTFDEVAVLYHEARPGYPEALFEDVVALSAIRPGGRVLEMGPGTGQATVPLARRGYSILGIELGETLAAAARRNLADFPRVAILTAGFEDWSVEEAAFDL